MIRIISLLSLSFFFLSCEKQVDDLRPTPEILIYNTSFEDQSALEEDHWVGTYALVADAAPNGGSSCLALEPQWLPSVGAAELELSLPVLNGAYRLSFWSKTINWMGAFTVLSRSGEEEQVILETSIAEEEWTLSTHEFTFESAETTSVVIRFSAGGTEVASGQVLIDELVLILD